MAKKEKLKLDPFELDSDLDFDMYSGGFDFDSEALDSKDDRNPVTKVIRGMGSGIVSTIKEPEFIQKTAKKALPPTYGEISSGVAEASKGVQSLYDETVKELKPQIQILSDKIDQLVPEEATVIKKVTKSLKSILGSQEDSQRGPSAEQLREQSITNDLSQVFGASLEYQQATDKKRDATDKIKQAIDEKRFTDSFGALSSIDENISRLTQYNDRVNQAYQKKSLELQFRSYYVQKELLESTKHYFEAFKVQNEVIAKNTGLPDSVKFQGIERLTNVSANKFWDSVYNRVVGDGSQIRRGFQRIQQSAREKIQELKEGIGSASDAIDGIISAREMGSNVGISGYEIAGNTIGSFGTQTLVDKAIPHIRRQVNKRPAIVEGLASVAEGVIDTPGMVRRYQDSERIQNVIQEGGVKGKAAELFGNFLSFFGEEDEDLNLTRKGGLDNLGRPNLAGFDNRSHITLNEVIPGYLSRIHQELRSARTGKESELINFDYVRNRFVDRSDLKNNLKDYIFSGFKEGATGTSADRGGNVSSYNVRDALERFTDEIQGGLNLTPEQRQEVKDFAFNISQKKNVDLTPENIKRLRDFGNLSRPMQGLVAGWLDNSTSRTKRRHQYDIKKRIQEVKSATPDARMHIDKLVTAGYGEILEEEGIISVNPDGTMEINRSKYNEFIREFAMMDEDSYNSIFGKDAAAEINKNSRKGPTFPSDLELKTNISKFSPKAALNAIKKTKVFNWNYKGSDRTFTGPMAQDVQRHLGNDVAPNGKKVDIVSMNGANMAAIQELSKQQESIKEHLRKGGRVSSNALLKEISRNTAETNRLLSSGGILGPLLGNLSITGSTSNRGYVSGFSKGISRIRNLGKKGIESIFSGITKTKDFLSDTYSENKYGINSRIGRVIDGTINLAGNIITGAKDLAFNTIPNSIKDAGNFISSKVKGGKDLLNNWLNKARDIYVPGERFPRIRAHLLSIGHYVDQATGKVIKTLEDLKSVRGNIVDKSGNVVMTLEELASGVKDAQGNDIRDLATSVGQFLASNAYKVISGAGERLSNAFSIIKDKTLSLGSRIKDSGSALFTKSTLSGDKNYNVLVQIRDILANHYGEPSKLASMSAIRANESSTQDNERESPDLPHSQETRYTSGGLLGAIGGKIGSIASSASGALEGLGDSLSQRGTRRRGRRGKLGAVLGMATGLLGKAASGAGRGLGALTSILGGGSTPEGDEGQESIPMSFIKSLMNKAKDKASNIKDAVVPIGKRAFNDLDGSGLRDGAWQERIEEWKEKQKQAREERKFKAEELAGRNKARYTDHSKSLINKLLEHSNALFKSLGGAVDWVKDKAGGLFGDILDGATDLPDGPDRKGERNPRGRTPRGPKGKGGFFRNLLQRGKNLAIRGALAAKPLLVAGGAKAAAGLGLAKTFLATKAAATTAAIATATSGMTLGGMAASAGAAIAGFLSSPVVIAGAAVAAVGAGVYFGYKHFTKNKLNELERFRLIQYGFSGEEESEEVYSKVLALEEFLSGKVKISESRSGSVSSSINVSRDDMKEILDQFDIDQGKPEQVAQFREWLVGRFQPIYVQHLRALRSVLPGKKLSELDTLKMSEQSKYFSRIRIDLIEQRYMRMMESPFDGIAILTDNKDLARRYRQQILISYFKDGEFDKGASSKLKSTSANGVIWSQTTLDHLSSNKEREKLSGLEKAQRAQKHHEEQAIERRRNQQRQRYLEQQYNRYSGMFPYSKPVDIEQDPGTQSLGAPMSTRGNADNSPPGMVTTGNLTMADGEKKSGDGALKYIKLAKGAKLKGLNPELLKNFLGMIEEYGERTGKKVQVNTAFRSYEEQAALHRQNPRKAARPGRSLHEFGLAIDMNTVDINALEKAGLMRKYGFTRPVGGETWHIEPAGIQVDVQKAKNDPAFATQAIIGSIGRGGGGYGSSKGTPLGRRNKELALKLLNAPATVVKSEDNEEKGSIPEPNLATNTTSTTPNRGTGRPSDLASMVSFNPPIGASANQDNFEGGYSGGYQTPTVQGQTYQGPSIPQKSPDFESKPTEDTGSATSSSEESTRGKGLLGTIAKFAQQVGVPAKLLQTLAIIESDLRPHAKASTSSAAGLFQFIKSTWKEVISKYGSKYGISPGTPPTDVRASTLMAGEYIKQNLRTISSVKPDANPVDAYLTHFLGPGGARTFLKADPNSIGAEALPRAAGANKSIFFDRGRPRTVAQIYELLKNRINNKTKRYGIDVSASMNASASVNQGTSSDTTGDNEDFGTSSNARQSVSRNSIGDFVGSSPTSSDSGVGVDYTSGGSSSSAASNPFAPPPNQFTPPSPVSDQGGDNFRGVEDKLTESVSIQAKMLDVLMEISGKIGQSSVSGQAQQAGIAKDSPPEPLSRSTRSNRPSAIDVKRRVA